MPACRRRGPHLGHASTSSLLQSWTIFLLSAMAATIGRQAQNCNSTSFPEARRSATVSRARASLDRMQALKQAAQDGIRLEVRRAYYDYDRRARCWRLQELPLPRRKRACGSWRNRYRAGMTTITDLLRAEDAARMRARTIGKPSTSILSAMPLWSWLQAP